MKPDSKNVLRLCGGVAAAALMMSFPAYAQDTAGDEEEQTKKLNKVTVTATRREASIQDVPIAVTAVSQIELDRQGVVDLRSLDQLSASFNLNSSQTESQGTTIRIRGVGTTGNNIGLESAVGVFLDGVYLARPGIALGDLVDLEQIEVLRGPQGTLFGRNTSAGALNITTNKPNLSEVEGFANASYGNLDFVNVQGGVSIPLIEDELGVRLSGAFRSREGILQNPTLGTESGNRDRFLLRGQLLWEPHDRMSIRIIGDYSEADEQCCDAVVLVDPIQTTGVFGALGPVPSTGVVDPSGGVPLVGFGALEDRVSNGEQFQNPFEQWGISGQIDLDLGWSNMTYIGSYRDFFAESVQESDFTGLQIFSVGGSTAIPNVPATGTPAFDDIKSHTHELRFQGTIFDDRLDWLVGGFYAVENIEEQATLTLGDDFDLSVGAAFGGAFGPSPIESVLSAPNPFANVLASMGIITPGIAPGVSPAGSFSTNQFLQDSTSWSIFTHNTFALTDNWDVTVGLRWVDEHKDGTFRALDGNSPACLAVITNFLEGDLDFIGDPGLVGAAVGATCFPFSTQANLPGSGVPGGLPTPATFSDDVGEMGVFVNDFEDEELVWTVKTAFRPTENINIYGGFTHGFKAGGFNLDSTAAVLGADPRFDSETIDAYEIGIKSDLFDGRVRANIAVFHQELSNFQVLEFTGVQFTTFNVGTALATGFEIEGQAVVTDQLTVNTAMTYSNARYPDDCAIQDPTNPAFNINAANLCGEQLTNAPEFVGIWGATWEDGFTAFGTDMTYFGNVNVRFETDRRTSTQATQLTSDTPLAFDIQEANTKVNLRFGIGRADGLWSIEGWARNVGDVQTRNVTFNLPLRTGTRGAFIQEPRTFGVTVRSAF